MGRFTSPPSRALAAFQKPGESTAADPGTQKLVLPAPFADTDGEEPENARDASIQEEIDEAREELRVLVRKLRTVTNDKDLDRLALEIQQLRVHLMLQNEVMTGKVDPDLHREMKLLRAMVGELPPDLPNQPDAEELTARIESAQERLDRDGIDPDRAARILRVAIAARDAMTKQEPAVEH